jgi:phenylalanyl-tRNA synthetase beta chain
MKLSYNWLKEYVDIGVAPGELARGLTMSGSEVETMSDVDGDKIMNLEITANRPDCLNIIGLAREAAAVFDKDLCLPAMELPEKAARGKLPEIECVIKDRKLCPRYTARVISDVDVKSSSDKIKERILAVGLRAVNNVVDITNFCLLETGQPLHAFDLDKLHGGKVIIREAVKGEKITTIDGVERELQPGMLVIADSMRAVAIAGVMGGKDTEVTENTKNVLLESAYFDPISVRRTSRALGISSDSSYRFERGVDKGMIRAASDRAAGLISAETGGKICEFYDAGKLAPDDVSIKFNAEKAEKVLNISLEKGKVKRIFQRLGMTVSAEKGSAMKVDVPSFREDLRREIDLIEEVARIYGYDNIPITITKFIPQVKRKEHSREVMEKLHEVLPALGLNEVMTYSLISETAIKRFSSVTEDTIQLINPLSEDHKILTTQLLDGMLRAISWNINRKSKDLGFFEIGKIYSRPGGKGSFLEIPAICIALTGLLRENWQEGKRPVNLYDLKGIIETAFSRLRVSTAFCEASIKGLENCGEVSLPDGDTSIGFFGEVNAKLLGEYDISQPVYICQVRLDEIMKRAVLENHYHAIPRFPSSSRDISVLCDRSLAAGEVHKVIAETGEEIIRGIELVDVYEGKQIPADKKSLSYSIRYGLDTRTLTDEEIEAMHATVKEALAKKLGVTFR